MRLVKQAAKTVYTTDKYQRRGEFFELLPHALLREVFNSEPAISKIYYKSATIETVKGFDAVHIVEAGNDLTQNTHGMGEACSRQELLQVAHGGFAVTLYKLKELSRLSVLAFHLMTDFYCGTAR
jgi:hypothetical protein